MIENVFKFRKACHIFILEKDINPTNRNYKGLRVRIKKVESEVANNERGIRIPSIDEMTIETKSYLFQ